MKLSFQAFRHDAVGHTLGIETVDQFVHGFILVDVQIQVGGGTGGRVDAVRLVVVFDLNLGVAHRDLDLSGFGVTLVAVVEDVVVAGHKIGAQLRVHHLAVAILICMCHGFFLLRTSVWG